MPDYRWPSKITRENCCISGGGPALAHRYDNTLGLFSKFRAQTAARNLSAVSHAFLV